MKKLAICIPTYNEKENLPEVIRLIQQTLKGLDINTKIIIIDDNSPDGTGKLADIYAQELSSFPIKVDVIHREGKLGLATAYLDAFRKALKEKFDYMLTMDADLSHQPKYIPDFLEKIKKYDLVIGSRNIKGGRAENWSLLRHLVSKGGSLYARTILGIGIKDFTGGFNMFRKKVLERIKLESIESRGYSFTIEMKYRAAKNGFSYVEIPIIFPDRTHGKAKMSKKIFLEALLRVWKLRFTKVTNKNVKKDSSK